MLDYLLKSGGCLLVLYLFYVLFLEKENMHVYKRVYLLSIIVVSFGIPFITFTNYVEVVAQIQPMIASNLPMELPIIPQEEERGYLPIVLWSIYGLGVLLFGLKFIKNSYEIVHKIKSNPKERKGETTSVLLNDDIVPHTFFNFIFYNKKKYTTHQIPNEVILHEETHARQKHSIDVLLLEFLQVVFWFNPVLFLLNRSVKLNHEFLADQAVLNTGANTKTYQKTLLAYSSNASQLQLANAINYSSIKKRFTVMKTHTSKKKIWLCSFILLPVVALLLFSFSTSETIHVNPELIKEEKSINEPVLEVSWNPTVYKLNNKIILLEDIKSEFVKLTDNKKTDLRINTKGSIDMSIIRVILNDLKGSLGKIILSDGAYIEDDTDYSEEPQKKATPKQIVEYNTLAQKYNAQPKKDMVVKLQEVNRLKYLYNLMTPAQKKTAETFPDFSLLPPPPPAPPKMPKNANYVVDNKKISYDEASKIKDSEIESVDVVTKDEYGNKLEKSIIYIYTKKEKKIVDESTRPVTAVNGIGCVDCKIELTKEKLAAIVLSVDKGEIISFNIKFPGKPTVNVKNSTVLNKEAKTFLAEAKIGQMVQIFALKSSAFKNSSAPVLFKIVE